MLIKRYPKGDIAYMIIVYAMLWFWAIIVTYPLLYVVSCSFSSPNAIISGKVWLLPVDFSLLGYQTIFQSNQVLIGFKNSFLYTVVGTLINLAMTLLAAYPLSRKDFSGRKYIMMLFTFTMFFSGGMIPSYLLIKTLGMLDKIWAMVVPGALSVWLLIIARSFFQSSIPDELYEAAAIDGCDDIGFFTRMVIPLSKPIIAVLALMYGVGHWNSYFDALIYLNKTKLFPLQIILRNILTQNIVDTASFERMNVQDAIQQQYLSELLKYALIVVASVPLLIFYPFIQKYFIKGVMIGSLKG